MTRNDISLINKTATMKELADSNIRLWSICNLLKILNCDMNLMR